MCAPRPASSRHARRRELVVRWTWAPAATPAYRARTAAATGSTWAEATSSPPRNPRPGRRRCAPGPPRATSTPGLRLGEFVVLVRGGYRHPARRQGRCGARHPGRCRRRLFWGVVFRAAARRPAGRRTGATALMASDRRALSASRSPPSSTATSSCRRSRTRTRRDRPHAARAARTTTMRSGGWPPRP